MRSVFDRHNFAFKWTYGEFEAARELMPWCLDQIVDAYSEIAHLLEPADKGALGKSRKPDVPAQVTIAARNAANLDHIKDKSVALVCIDPPYYDNVMYAELSDFFYVWEKRTLGLIHPELFVSELTDKQNEAVANEARFADMGKRRKELANADYEAKMAAIFAEAERILREDGVMTVMFTHKRAEAWDTLGMALMQSGFTIETSWPVNTESETSLHQAKKNAAASTIMLVCRKREKVGGQGAHPYFEDIEGDVRVAARDALARFQAAGISGVDLLLATYGPALSVISSSWPVYSSQADPDTGRSRLLRPEEALNAAREEVVRLQRQRLVGTPVTLDPLSDFAIIAWDTFRAAEFPFDEARRLALAVGGLDVDELAHARLIAKKSGTVQLLTPDRRLRRGEDRTLPGVRPGATSFGSAIDALHTVMYVADEDGLPAAKAVIDRAGVRTDTAFRGCLQGLVNAIPRTKQKGEWVRPEAGTLDRICSLYFPDIDIPPDTMVPIAGEQGELDLGV
jgi:putative DNA methylase